MGRTLNATENKKSKRAVPYLEVEQWVSRAGASVGRDQNYAGGRTANTAT